MSLVLIIWCSCLLGQLLCYACPAHTLYTCLHLGPSSTLPVTSLCVNSERLTTECEHAIPPATSRYMAESLPTLVQAAFRHIHRHTETDMHLYIDLEMNMSRYMHEYVFIDTQIEVPHVCMDKYKHLQRQICTDTQPHMETDPTHMIMCAPKQNIGKYRQVNYIDMKTCIHRHVKKHLDMCTLTRGQT